MAVDIQVSHMTLLIVTLAFSLVNICLIIATGGIIYNWQDRFVGPVMKCDQPKWTTDGRDQSKVRTGYVYNYNTNNVLSTGTNWGTGYNTGVAAGVSGTVVSASVGTSGTVMTAGTNWGSASTNSNWGYTVTMGVASGVLGSSSWRISNGAWTTCPYIEYPRWQQQVQQTTQWGQWNTGYVSQPTGYVAQPSGGYVSGTVGAGGATFVAGK